MSDSYKIYASKDYVDGKALPDGAAANMQLITDTEGNTVWQERTHYDGDFVETALIAETTHDFTEDQFWYNNGLALDMTGGTAYTVVWDGVEYERTVVDTGWGTFYMGNGYIYELTEEDSGEPFLMLNEGGGLVIGSAGDNAFAEHTFSVKGLAQHIERLPERFLPESVITTNNIFDHTVGSAYYVDNVAKGEVFNDYGYNIASGAASHAEGSNTISSGESSHVEGCSSVSQGFASHAEGLGTEAIGEASHAEGHFTSAYGNYQHVQGRYNIYDTEYKYSHIVGNGTNNSGVVSRSNAHTLDWDGNAWYAGSVEGTVMILKSSTEGSTKRFKITVDDSGTLTATEIVE